MSYILYTSQFSPSLTVCERNPLDSTQSTQPVPKPRHRRQHRSDIHPRNWSKRRPSNPRFSPTTVDYPIFRFKRRCIEFTTNRAKGHDTKTRSTYTRKRVRVRKSKPHRLLRVNQPEICWIPESGPVCCEVRCNTSDPGSATPDVARWGGGNPSRIERFPDLLELAIDNSRLDQTFQAFRAFVFEMQW